MRSSVASRNRIGPNQRRPIGCGNGLEARRQSACYHTTARMKDVEADCQNIAAYFPS
jgi:hypothetical protein